MLFRIFLCTACAVAMATPALAKDKSAAAVAEPISCSGAFGADSSEDMLIETFGADNVTTGLVDGPEGTQYIATTVYPRDPEREMVFSWFDEDRLEKLSAVELAPSQSGPGGIRLGMSVADVQAINEEPFNIGGFWWDYGGYALLETGTLAGPLDGDCYVSLRFSPEDEIPTAIDITSVVGEVQVSSEDPLLAEIGTRVTSLSLGYALDPIE
ncbi:MAG: hypothetical protein P0Y65_13045 [Candidatus Devosia phytovorans]|uniref:Uncharacterized protein n=1 Tax=Candidatus Devosia phytovorans TaxID=3121372 RepID=A0AAJ6B047_9HYPH|nr:hypothetical protein [Devosia sp.]WEK03128.1 MAG: hypothetical protein P0Y65_13045 [Devosia sp.]